MLHSTKIVAALAAITIFSLPITVQAQAHGKTKKGPATIAEAEKFLKDAEARLDKLSSATQRASWVYETHITDDTESIAAQANELSLEAAGEIAIQARRYNKLPLSVDSKRKLKLLQLSLSLSSEKDRGEYSRLAAQMNGAYGKGKYCPNPSDEKSCLNLGQLEKILATSHNPAELKDAWLGWHQTAMSYKDSYAKYVQVSNKGAREMGFADTGALWRSQYDMPPEAFAAETERLWQQVKPLYDSLHQYVRLKLQQTYGKDEVPSEGPIPAHLFGNMWSQSWDNLYPLVKPQGPAANLDIAEILKQKNIDAKAMTQFSEGFYTSLGMEKLPASFWSKSQLTKPRDREVVCHASAWDLDNLMDVRIKMCINQTTEDFLVIHHELGHIYYDLAYRNQPHLFKGGANDGFHEAIGDTVALSVTPAYLNKLGLLAEVPDASQDIGVLLDRALQKVAFLPFSYLVDQWRWKVYSGQVQPQDYDKVWWELREKYQGVKRPAPMIAGGFDAGAKYHVASDTPYSRYFIAHILQFQLHRALCREAGYSGPLNRCSIYENKAAGKKFQAMLAMGASRPWNEALQAVTGEDKLDASAIIDYFAPLKVWLDAQNKSLAK
ncbi:MAG: M2 family metallopeptidase [Undibacterium sp.]|nr:M2 family metallopeptidase [Undibacterium sp.]